MLRFCAIFAPVMKNRAGQFAFAALLSGALVFSGCSESPKISKAEASGECDRLIREGEWKDAAPFCEKGGDGRSLFWLAEMRARGEGKPQDAQAAAKLYKQSAEKKHGKANFVMGFFAFGGRDEWRGVVVRDKAAAEKYFEEAARRDDPFALWWRANHLTGLAYDNWDKELLSRAFEDKRKAAELGMPHAMFYMYQARMWAADKGECRENPIEFSYEGRLKEEAIRHAKRFLRVLPEARCDKAEAMQWLRRVAETAKYPTGMLTLGKEMEERGEYAEAHKWFYLVEQKKIAPLHGSLTSARSPYFQTTFDDAALDNYAEIARENLARLNEKTDGDAVAEGKKMAEEFWDTMQEENE